MNIEKQTYETQERINLTMKDEHNNNKQNEHSAILRWIDERFKELIEQAIDERLEVMVRDTIADLVEDKIQDRIGEVLSERDYEYSRQEEFNQKAASL